jgi:hypothetical protein
MIAIDIFFPLKCYANTNFYENVIFNFQHELRLVNFVALHLFFHEREPLSLSALHHHHHSPFQPS